MVKNAEILFRNLITAAFLVGLACIQETKILLSRFTTTKTLYSLYICCLFCYWYINDLIYVGDTCAQSRIIAKMCLRGYSLYKVIIRVYHH